MSLVYQKRQVHVWFLVQNNSEKHCSWFIKGRCSFGERCRYQHRICNVTKEYKCLKKTGNKKNARNKGERETEKTTTQTEDQKEHILRKDMRKINSRSKVECFNEHNSTARETYYPSQLQNYVNYQMQKTSGSSPNSKSTMKKRRSMKIENKVIECKIMYSNIRGLNKCIKKRVVCEE